MNSTVKRMVPFLGVILVLLMLSQACVVPATRKQNESDPQAAPTMPAGENAPQASSDSGSVAKATQSMPGSTQDDDEAFQQPDPLDRLLDLRSIEFNLTTQRPDGTSRTIEGEIDSSGNMHLRFSDPPYDVEGMPEGFKADSKAPVTEVYVLQGKAYVPDADAPDWKTTPLDENFLASFAQELHGMESLALWLDILPAGSLTPVGTEEVGGFQTNRYGVDGKISEKRIFGSLWKEAEHNALVQAEIHIPASLFSTADEPSSGEMLITLKAQRAKVEEISLPQ